MGKATIEDPGRPAQAADRTGARAPARTRRHCLRAQGEHGRLGIHLYHLAGIRPPSDHTPRDSTARARSDSTRITRASSARTEVRRGPDKTTRWECAVRTSARPRGRARPSGGCPTSGRGRRRRGGEHGPVQRAPQAGGPRHGFGAHRRPGPRRETGRASGRAARRTSSPRAPTERTRPAWPSRPRRVKRARPVTSMRTAASPSDRRAVRAGPGERLAAGPVAASPPRADRTSWSVTRKGPVARVGRPGWRASISHRPGRSARMPRRQPAVGRRAGRSGGHSSVAARWVSHVAIGEAMARRCSSRTSRCRSDPSSTRAARGGTAGAAANGLSRAR